MSTSLSKEFEGLYDPYKTTYGKMINVDGVRRSLAELVIRGDDRTYGINFDNDTEVVIITGKNKEEESIPPFELPIPFKTGGNKNFIGIDLREYMSNTVKNVDILSYTDLLGCMPRHDNSKILFRMASVMSTIMNGELGKIPKDDFIAVYVCLYATIIGSVVKLEPNDELACKVILGLWAYLLCCTDDISTVDINMVTRMIINKLRISTNSKTIDWCKEIVFRVSIAINNLQVSELRSVEGFCKVISTVFTEDVAKFFNAALFSNQLKNVWYGPGKAFAAISSMECIPVFIGITEGALGVTTFKSSRLTQMLNKYSRVINSSEYIKKCERNFPYRQN